MSLFLTLFDNFFGFLVKFHTLASRAFFEVPEVNTGFAVCWSYWHLGLPGESRYLIKDDHHSALSAVMVIMLSATVAHHLSAALAPTVAARRKSPKKLADR